jgi:hypothetical protein
MTKYVGLKSSVSDTIPRLQWVLSKTIRHTYPIPPYSLYIWASLSLFILEFEATKWKLALTALLNDGGPKFTCTLTIDDFASNYGRSICRLWRLTLLGNLVLEHTSHWTWVVISTWPINKSQMQSMTFVDWTQHLSMWSCAKVCCPIVEDYILSNHCYLCTLAFAMNFFPM